MAIYSVTFNLNDAETDYKGLHEALQSYPESKRLLDAMWIVQTEADPEQIYAELRRFFDRKGRLTIFEVAPSYQGWLKPDEWDWVDELFETESV